MRLFSAYERYYDIISTKYPLSRDAWSLVTKHLTYYDWMMLWFRDEKAQLANPLRCFLNPLQFMFSQPESDYLSNQIGGVTQLPRDGNDLGVNAFGDFFCGLMLPDGKTPSDYGVHRISYWWCRSDFPFAQGEFDLQDGIPVITEEETDCHLFIDRNVPFLHMGLGCVWGLRLKVEFQDEAEVNDRFFQDVKGLFIFLPTELRDEISNMALLEENRLHAFRRERNERRAKLEQDEQDRREMFEKEEAERWEEFAGTLQYLKFRRNELFQR